MTTYIHEEIGEESLQTLLLLTRAIKEPEPTQNLLIDDLKARGVFQ